jgi:hypothetical protein
MDAMRFRWDRYVVRFSDEDQLRGIHWIARQAGKLPGIQAVHIFNGGMDIAVVFKRELMPGKKALYLILAIATLLFALFMAWRWRTRLKRLFCRADIPPGVVVALRPLIRTTRLQPLAGETLRLWFNRLALIRPDRRVGLKALADLIESSIYGQRATDLVQPIKTEAREWRRRLSR